ncbi:putative 3TM holin [compost metagenome]
MANATATIAVHLDVWTMAAALICSAICARIVTYHRGAAKYKVGFSLMAWVLAAPTGCYSASVVLTTLAGRAVDPVSPLLVVVLLVLAVQVFLARGNVANVLRLSWDQPWSGIDRRRTGH